MSMAALRRQTHLPTTLFRRFKSSLIKPSHHKDHAKNHVYLEPTKLIGSFVNEDPPKNPKEAEAKLASLRRDYAKQVKDLRKQFIYEMDLQREEMARKDEARKLELMRAKEERKKMKAAAVVSRADERKESEEEFRLSLVKQRKEKLKYWRRRAKAIEERKNSKKERIRRESSTWIEEDKLEKRILAAIVETRQL